MASGEYAGHTIQSLAEIVPVPGFSWTRVNRHSNADRFVNAFPNLSGDLMLCRRRGVNGICRRWKHGAKTVSHRLENMPAVFLDDGPQ